MRSWFRLAAAVLALATSCGVGHAYAGQHGSQRRLGGASYSYPEEGVTVGPPSKRAVHDAAVSSLPNPKSVVAALRQLRWAPAAFKTGGPSVSLRSVTEKYPHVRGVSAGVTYQAWVVSVRGPVTFTGGPGSTPPPADTKCTDVVIYDLHVNRWTESLQSC